MIKILKIEKKVPKTVILPDGTYLGMWGGSSIDVKYKGDMYMLTTEVGVRGMNIQVIVTIIDGVATFETTKN